MGQPAPACCVCLATSKLAQAVYLGLLVLCLVVYVALGWVVATSEDEENEGLYAVESVTGLVIFVTAITMSASRLCAPCCCEGLEEAGQCCPCSCFLHLDTPLYVMAGLGIVSDILAWTFEAGSGADTSSLSAFRGLRMVGTALYIASVVCAIVKLCIMAQLCCQTCLPKVETDTVAVPQDGAVTIVGQPVGQPAPDGLGKVAT